MPLSRRRLFPLMVLAAASAVTMTAKAQARTSSGSLKRTWARGGLDVPMLGLGTWQSFDVDSGGAEFAQARAGLDTFLSGGGRVIDTSPMYGRAEAALGAALAQAPPAAAPWLASKIWTDGRDSGQQQLARTLALLKRPQIELMQIHNLRDADTHLPTLQAARESGQVRWIGVTHYTAGAHAELERWLRRDVVDAVQVNFSLAEPQAAQRVLPAAHAEGKLVLINRPFAEGAMFSRVRGLPLPGVAGELGCTSAAQLFLKWIAATPGVHCILTGTRKPAHVADNLAGLSGVLPDPGQRAEITRWWSDLAG